MDATGKTTDTPKPDSVVDSPELKTPVPTPEPNPWGGEKEEPVSVPFEAVTVNRTPSSPSPPPQVNQVDVLTEFDPLASKEEMDAREAWEESEGHPPPPRTPSPPPVPPPAPQSASQSAFPSLAAFARNFSIPSLPRGRPLSLDVATVVPSPATLSSFAEQQKRSTAVSKVQPEPNDMFRATSDSVPVVATPEPEQHAKDKEKDKEPAFDFQKFLDQMKTKSAEPIAKYLRSFLSNFAKRTFTVNDQVKIINDFLNFISGRMRETDVWKKNTDAEFDNAMEGMEKLVMNRLYDFTFTPQIALAVPPRPVTADDLERDRVLTQRVALFGWIEGHHLDIPEGEGSTGFLMFAQQELLKINHYKAPRDKLICILNTCKVIFGLIRHMRKEEGADSFLPILIFIVLKANPDHLLSNVEFIQRFRNPEKLQSEAGYYLSSLMGAVSFIETMDHTSLSNISQEEFEKNVEAAILALPLEASPAARVVDQDYFSEPKPPPAPSPHAGEESAQPLALTSPNALEDARRLLQKTGDTISKPLNAIGRIFNEVLDGAESKLPTYLPGPFAPFELGREARHDTAAAGPSTPSWGGQSPGETIQTPYKQRVRRIPSPGLSPGVGGPTTPTRGGIPQTNAPLAMGPSLSIPRLHALARSEPDLAYPGGGGISRTPTPTLDIPGLQAEIDSAHEQAATAAHATLYQIFPGTDSEVVEWVLEANAGDLGRSIEALLEMSTAS